jgi:hypothetical protein
VSAPAGATRCWGSFQDRAARGLARHVAGIPGPLKRHVASVSPGSDETVQKTREDRTPDHSPPNARRRAAGAVANPVEKLHPIWAVSSEASRTSQQDLALQLDALNQAGCERIFRDVGSGTLRKRRPPAVLKGRGVEERSGVRRRHTAVEHAR